MYCTNCGKEIDDKAVICVHCGVKTTPLSVVKETKPYIPSYEKESYIMNCTAGSLLMWMLFQIVITFALAFIFVFAFGFLFEVSSSYGVNPYLSDFETSSIFQNFASLLATVGSSLFAVLMFKSMLKLQLPTMKKFNMSFSKILYYTAIGMGLSSLASYGITFLNYLMSFLNIRMTTPDFSLQFSFGGNLLLILTTCVAAPIFEELLFRGLILTALKRFGNMFAIIITSLLFALAHGNLPQTVPVFFLSMVLCYVALRSKSLLPTITIHFINNAIAMLFTFLQGVDGVWIISLLFDIAVILFALITLFKKRKQIKTYIQKHKGTSLLSYFKHWAPITFSILSVILILFSFALVYSV